MIFWLGLFVLGLLIGSFFNVLIIRYEPSKNFFNWKRALGRSRCMSCERSLSWYELVPVLSWVCLRGRCSKCGESIAWQYPVVEILTGLITFGVPYWLVNKYFIKQLWLTGQPLDWFYEAVIIWVLVVWLLLILSVIDYRLKIIPNEINLVLLFLGIVLTYSQWAYDKFGLAEGTFLGGYAAMLGFRGDVWLNHLLAGGVALGFFLLIVILSRGRGMGMGDVKLAGALGVLFGWPDVILIIGLAFILGAVVGLWLIIKDRGNVKRMVPFGPFLVLGAGLVLFWGEKLLHSYFGLFGII